MFFVRSQVRLFMVLAVMLLALAGAATVSAEGPVTVTLMEQNRSGEKGTATLTDLGNGKIRVEVEVTGAPADVPQPLHIHEGTCATLNPKPKYPLTAAVNGKSVTEIEVTLAELQSKNYAINGHKSAAEIPVYVFCGDIPLASSLPTTGGDFNSTLLLLGAFGVVVLAAGLALSRLAPSTR